MITEEQAFESRYALEQTTEALETFWRAYRDSLARERERHLAAVRRQGVDHEAREARYQAWRAARTRPAPEETT